MHRLETYLITLLLILLTACSNEQALEEEIIGYWTAVPDKEKLIELGASEEHIEKIKIELHFDGNGHVKIRTNQPQNFGGNKMSRSGVYKIQEDQLRMSFAEGVWENQTIEFSGDQMTLAPIEFKGEIVNTYNRIEGWTVSSQ